MIIYKITNLINNKSYIGQTTQKLSKRWGDHCSKGATCKAISRAICKYGKHNFTVEPILSVLNKKDLNEFETYFIKYYDSFGKNGYNLSMGSEGDGSEVLKKPVVGYNYKTNTSFYLNCINHGSRYGIDPRSIQRALKGEYNIVKGYFWFYVNEFNMDNLNKKLDRELTKRKRKNGTSKYKGVSLCRQTQKWYACIMVNQKTINLGVYSTEIEASAAYIIKFKGVFYR